jgi:hypothetical protein
MPDSQKNPTDTNFASHPAIVEYNARADALRAKSNSVPATDTAPPDRSLEFAIALENARSIADLIFTVCGGSSGGEDCQIDGLAKNTLSAAVHCIMVNVETAQEIEREAAEQRQRKVEAAKASASH